MLAVGALALDANTTGNNGTAMGYGALSANTTAANNTAFGYLVFIKQTPQEHRPQQWELTR